MAERAIYLTASDKQRLQDLINSARGVDDRDRPYLAALQTELDKATVLEVHELPPDVVTMNSHVRLRDGRRTWSVSLVFPDAADPELGQISVLAPLGAAVLGCRVGQRVEFRVPGGAVRACDILSVLYQPEAAGHRHV